MNTFTVDGHIYTPPKVVLKTDGEWFAQFILVHKMTTYSHTSYFNCIANGGTAKYIQAYLVAGSVICITGSIYTYKNKLGQYCVCTKIHSLSDYHTQKVISTSKTQQEADITELEANDLPKINFDDF